MKSHHYRSRQAEKKAPPDGWGAARDLALLLGALYFIGRAIVSFLGY